ncbi:MAG: ABC transporter permease [Chloroflexi bacterium]|nr:ABC transporter permease [Chloroflexota bacterium]
MSNTSRYIIRRAIQSLILLWLITIISFTLMRLAPGGPESFIEDPRVKEADKLALRASYGLDEPIPVQYIKWLAHVLQGDFGRSFLDQRPVMDKIAERLPATITLNLASVIIGMLGIPMGMYAAVHHGKWLDRALGVFNAFLNSAPHWWIGLLVLLFIAAPTRWFPLGGMFTIGKENDILDRLWHLILPATISGMGGWLVWPRYLRSSILEVIRLDYIRTAHAKGLAERVVLFRHAFRNSLIPVVPLFVGSIVGLISGSVIYENVFSWPGIGRMAVQATFQRDYPVVMALFVIGSTLAMFALLAIDVIYTFVDPRVKYN